VFQKRVVPNFCDNFFIAVVAQNVLLWPVRNHEDALFTRQWRYEVELLSVQGRVKCPTNAASVPQRPKLVTGTRTRP